jgi:hypothetical protein
LKLGGGVLGLYKAVDPVTATIGGGTVYSVIGSMVDAITTLTRGVDQQEQEIEAFLGRISQLLGGHSIAAPRPDDVTNLSHAGAGVLAQQFHPR